MTLWHWLAAVALATVLSFPNVAKAGSARVQGFAGHRVLEDETDIFRFPGLLFANTDRLMLDFEPLASGNGGVVWGKKRIIGLFASRTSLTINADYSRAESLIEQMSRSRIPAPNEQRSEIHLVNQPARPAPMVDVLLGLSSGFGVRVSVANTFHDLRTPVSSDPNLSDGDAPPAGVDEDGAQATSFDLAIGWSRRTDQDAIDAAVTLTFNSLKSVTNGFIDAERRGTPSLRAQTRIGVRMDAGYELVALAQVDQRSDDIDFPRDEADLSASITALELALGPRIQLGDRAQFATSLVFGGSWSSAETTRTNSELTQSSERVLTIPGIDASIEGWVTDWAAFRAGFSSRYTMVRKEQGLKSSLVEQQDTAHDYLWSAGVTLRFGDLDVEGAFKQELVTSGPSLLGGENPGLFAMLSASYRFGANSRGVQDAALPQFNPSSEPPPPLGYE